jgi:hypothetical protein
MPSYRAHVAAAAIRPYQSKVTQRSPTAISARRFQHHPCRARPRSLVSMMGRSRHNASQQTCFDQRESRICIPIARRATSPPCSPAGNSRLHQSGAEHLETSIAPGPRLSPRLRTSPSPITPGQIPGENGGRTRTRTLDPLIKSQLLYQLSYAPARGAPYSNPGLPCKPPGAGSLRLFSQPAPAI